MSASFESRVSMRFKSRGNMLASRTFFRPSICIVMRSAPRAKPPSGGAPYLNASRNIEIFSGPILHPFTKQVHSFVEFWMIGVRINVKRFLARRVSVDIDEVRARFFFNDLAESALLFRSQILIGWCTEFLERLREREGRRLRYHRRQFGPQ